jgi:hypothetical protein
MELVTGKDQVIKHYLFFLRHFNDTDNIAPVIYHYLLANKTHQATVIYYDRKGYDFEADRNLKLICDSFGSRISIFGFWDFETRDYGKDASRINIEIGGSLTTVGEALNCLVGCRNDLADQLKVKIRLQGLLFHLPRVDLVAFDLNRAWAIQPITSELRSMGIERIVGLPVSPLINYNVLREYPIDSVGTEEFFNNHDYSEYDRMAHVDNHFYLRMEEICEHFGYASTLRNKVDFLGSPRYTPSWVTLRPTELVSEDINRHFLRGEKNIVFLLSRSKSNVNEKEVSILINLVKQNEAARLIVKAHTRDYADSFQKLPEVELGHAYDTPALLKWADLVIFWSTSAAIEGILQNKTLFCVDYLVGNISLYNKYNIGLVARCRDDFAMGLKDFLDDRPIRNYNSHGGQQLMDECITPGGDETINRYLRFLAENERPCIDFKHAPITSETWKDATSHKNNLKNGKKKRLLFRLKNKVLIRIRGFSLCVKLSSMVIQLLRKTADKLESIFV